jgi:hypothetical protein
MRELARHPTVRASAARPHLRRFRCQPRGMRRSPAHVPSNSPRFVLARREMETASTAATGTSVAVADRHYPRAEKIHVVLDNLSTHSAARCTPIFPAPIAADHAGAGQNHCAEVPVQS